MTLPLYQDLKQKVVETDLSHEEKENLIKKIKKLDQTGHELVYALIRCYQLEHESNYGLPYDGKNLKLGYKFDLEKLPVPLRQILLTFTDKHLEKMKEEAKINKNRKS